MHIAVVGSGYVGLVTGACFAEFGVDVICVDVAVDKIERLTRGDSPIYEPGLEQLIRKNLQAGRLSFTTDIASAIRQSLVVFIAVARLLGTTAPLIFRSSKVQLGVSPSIWTATRSSRRNRRCRWEPESCSCQSSAV